MLTMGADRILFASDYPYEDYAEAGEFMDPVAISESDRRKIAYGNAKALLQALEGRPSALILLPASTQHWRLR